MDPDLGEPSHPRPDEETEVQREAVLSWGPRTEGRCPNSLPAPAPHQSVRSPTLHILTERRCWARAGERFPCTWLSPISVVSAVNVIPGWLLLPSPAHSCIQTCECLRHTGPSSTPSQPPPFPCSIVRVRQQEETAKERLYSFYTECC